jgi:hypothetical protein
MGVKKRTTSDHKRFVSNLIAFTTSKIGIEKQYFALVSAFSGDRAA